MKFLYVFALLLFAGIDVSLACCSPQRQYPLDDTYTYLKSYRLDTRGEVRKRIVYTTVFSIDTDYQWTFYKSSHTYGQRNVKVTLNIYKADLKSKPIASFTAEGSQEKGILGVYYAKKTAIYYLEFLFDKALCANVATGYHRPSWEQRNLWKVQTSFDKDSSCTQLQYDIGTEEAYGEFFLKEDTKGYLRLQFKCRDESWEYTCFVRGKSTYKIQQKVQKAFFKQYGLQLSIDLTRIEVITKE